MGLLQSPALPLGYPAAIGPALSRPNTHQRKTNFRTAQTRSASSTSTTGSNFPGPLVFPLTARLTGT
jgi:hypothetical protein